MHTGSEALEQRLEQYAPDGVRVSVVDIHGWLLGSRRLDRRRAPPPIPAYERDEEGFTRSIYRVLFPASEARASLRPALRHVG